MSILCAYYAGNAAEIDSLLNRGSGLPESSARNNWLGRGIYFWNSDPRRAEHWQAIHGKGAILEYKLEAELLIDMLIDNQRSSGFLDLTQTILPSVDGINDRESQYFNRADEIINRLLPRLQDAENCGIRMAFFLDGPIAPHGDLFPNQHI
jgi:hypothetical protein